MIEIFWINQVLITLIIVFLSIIVHELSHYFKAQSLGWNLKISFEKGLRSVFIDLSKVRSSSDQFSILWTGVFYGFVFNALVSVLFLSWPFAIISIVGYFVGTRHDLRMMRILKGGVLGENGF